jgi:pimeloyl-ACP methyl ester carboxylesterase
MAFIEIDSMNIYYERKGTGNKQIVFVHGNSLSSKLFDKQFNDDKLLTNYELIRFDLPGFGNSEYATDKYIYSFQGFAKVFKELYEQLNITNAVLVGNSLGGHLILETIENLKNVKGVLISGTPPFAIPPADNIFLPNPNVLLFFQEEHTTKELDALVNSMINDNKFTEQVKTEVLKSDGSFRNVWMTNFQTFLPKDEIEIIKNLSIPVAVLHCKNEKLVNFEYLKTVQFNDLWKNEIRMVDDACHLPFLEQPEIYNSHLLNFCNSLYNN